MIRAIIFLSALGVLAKSLQCQPDKAPPCGVPRKEIIDLIVGGKIADAKEHPWHSALFHWSGSGWEYNCGGTLINQLLVVTAHHCTLDNGVGCQVPLGELLVMLGLQELDDDTLHSQKYSVSAIHTLAGKQLDNFRNDIALIELNTTVQFTEYILPACLVNQDVAVNETGTVVGFGSTENKTISRTLRVLKMPVLNPVTYLRRHNEFVHLIDERQFCAGHTDGRTVCNGDSGGGFVLPRNGTIQLAGIVSFTAARGTFDYSCKEDGYAVYTNIYSYLWWIEKMTKGIYNRHNGKIQNDTNCNFQTQC